MCADTSARRFRIAFSFAGEKRDFVEKVAQILAGHFSPDKILYDKFHEAEFARHDLGIYLPKLYGEQSDLIVPVLCPNYDQKRWTGWEWLHIYGLLTKADAYRVMPCRFAYAQADGLSPACGFIELDEKTPEQTVTLILERLALNEGKPKDHYTKPAIDGSKPLSTTIPNNLPRLQSFFGRTEELKQIAEALDPENRTWGALIDGPGGMGKTSLAVRAAYDCPSGQFQRIIFLSVKDRELDDDGVRQLGVFILPGFIEMLNELARQLGQQDITKAPEDQRIRILLDALRPAQVLLILDNLESLPRSDRDQLLTFVKRLPQGCKAILTSRRRIGSASEELILEQLDQTAALATLADLARHNKLLAKTGEAERITLYQQTAGKPLLLRWVAGQLGRGSCRTIADALHFLRTCPPNNDPLAFIFNDLAAEFTPEETRVLCGLTYFTFPAKAQHIAEAAGLSTPVVETALKTLLNRSLIVPDQEETAFALVPRVTEFLRRNRPEIIAETGNRIEQRAYALIVENGDRQHDRFPLLEAAWPCVASALPLFLAGPNRRLQVVCGALAIFLDFMGRWDESFSLNQQAEAKAITVGDYIHAGWRAYHAGMIHYLRQQADEALALACRAETHWQRAQAGATERASAIHLRGLGHRLKGDYRAAIAAFREGLELDRSVSPQSMNVAIYLNALADAERDSGDFAGAERDCREALHMARTVIYPEGVATYTGNLAELALLRRDWFGAEALAHEALILSEELHRQELIAIDCRRLAAALVHEGKPAEALPYARRAVDIFTKLCSPCLEGARTLLDRCAG